MNKKNLLLNGFFMFFLMLCGGLHAEANAGDDTIPTATVISPNTKIEGVLASSYDDDYYAVKAPENGRFTISMPNKYDNLHIDITDENSDGYAYADTDSAYLGNVSRSVDVAKGTAIYVKIKPAWNSRYSQPYLFKVSFKAGDNYEKEWNDDLRSATKIDPTSKTKAILKNEYDYDYFKVKLTKPGNLNLSMSNAGVAKSVTLLDGNLNEYSSFTTDNSYLGKSSMNTGLPKGTFYIKVKQYDHYGDNSFYQLNLKYTQSNFYEKESNDVVRAANLISLNKTYSASFQSRYDDDYFKFKVSKKGTYKLYLSNGGNSKNLYLYNAKQQDVTYLSADPDSNSSFISQKVVLKKGTYYVKTELGSYVSNIDYQFKVSKLK